VQYLLNTTYRERLRATPMQLMSGQSPARPFDIAMARRGIDGKFLDAEPVKVNVPEEYLQCLIERLEEYRVRAREGRTEMRRKDRRLNRNFRAKPADFAVGLYVLVARVNKQNNRSKLLMTWRGPYLVVEAKHSHLYTVRSLVDDSLIEVHASRMKIFGNQELDVTIAVKDLITLHDGLYHVEELLELKLDEEGTEQHVVRVKWLGFEEECTEELVERLAADVPKLVDAFLKDKKKVPAADAVVVRRFLQRKKIQL
jgi:hypothetical protein